MVMIFMSQKSIYTQWNFPTETYPKIAGLVIYSLCFTPTWWTWFTLQAHYMHRKNAFMAGKTSLHDKNENLANFKPKTNLLPTSDTHLSSSVY
jgi:hypothetical protein